MNEAKEARRQRDANIKFYKEGNLIMTKDTSGPAFPHSIRSWNDHLSHEEVGMTKREYAAIHAMAGILANPKVDSVPDQDVWKGAIYHADALLRALEGE